MFSGKIHYFDWAIFNRFLYVYQARYFQGEHDDHPLDPGFSRVFYAQKKVTKTLGQDMVK